MQKQMLLPTTFEQSSSALNPEDINYSAKLAQFVQPVEETEREIVNILSRVAQGSGRAAILLGGTGAGKSTFIHSLTWRKHIGIARIVSIDCSDLHPAKKLEELAAKLQTEGKNAISNAGITAISVDYLESLGGISDPDKRSFFQTVNGILRKSPIFLIWPMTDENDAKVAVKEAQAVSSTVFDAATPIVRFKGPNIDNFPSIVKNTIAVFNGGAMLQDFLLTEAELDKIRDDLVADHNSKKLFENLLRR